MEMDMMERTAKIERLIDKVGGRFALTVLIQKRIREINHQESRLLVDCKSPYLLDAVLEEIEQGRITLA